MLSEFKVVNVSKEELENRCRVYKSLCLHCSRRPHIFRRSLGVTFQASKPREIITMDFLSVENKSLLVIMDMYSRKTMLRVVENKTATEAAKGLLEWQAHLGLIQNSILVTDNGSHFANILLKSLSKALRFDHQFSIAYSPWSNGSIESRNPSILKLLRTLTSELRLTKNEWSDHITIINHIINTFY